MGIENINNVSFHTQQVSKNTRIIKVDENIKNQDYEEAETQTLVRDIEIVETMSGKEKTNDSQSNEQKKENLLNNDTIKKVVDDINKKMQNTEVKYGVHEGTNRFTIKILDRTTKDVIKEITPEKMLDMLENIWETAGILLDEKR